jgi:hypothetical protein
MRLDLLQTLRQRLDLDETDPSKDAEILAMTPVEKLEELFGWTMGDDSWAYTVLDWMRECGFQFTSDPK